MIHRLKKGSMTEKNEHIRIIVSGGGTGGHVFPAIAIADALKSSSPGMDILFVGAENRLEMDKVPLAGYRIIGLPVEGFRRKLSLKNVMVLFNLLRSLAKSRGIISDFKPHAVIGVGGYASGPVLRVAARRGIPTLIQEQNSYAGITNKLLAGRARKICVAYSGMDRFFPAEKIILTGNPVREEIRRINNPKKRDEGLRFFELRKDVQTILILGGSLGARTINQSILSGIPDLKEKKVQILWQCGMYYLNEVKNALGDMESPWISLHAFIEKMDLAYAAADIVVARAGAITISELCYTGKPVILVPSPNVAEDHQTKNAMALVNVSAGIHIPDNLAVEQLVPAVMNLLNDRDKMEELSENISALAMEDPAARIAGEIISMIN